MARPLDDEVDMSRTQFQSYAFHFFFAAGKACLMPFLTIYFRFLGLTAWQTGLAIGLKSFVGMVSSPCWTRCATRCRKKRFVLMFSVFVLMLSYVMMVLIPQVDPAVSLKHCHNKFTSPNVSGSSGSVVPGSGEHKVPVDATQSPDAVTNSSSLSSMLASLPSTVKANVNEQTLPPEMPPSHLPSVIPSSDTVKEDKSKEELPTQESQNSLDMLNNVEEAKEDESKHAKEDEPKEVESKEDESPLDTEGGYEKTQLFDSTNQLTDDELELLKTLGIEPSQLDGMTADEVEDYIQLLIERLREQLGGGSRRRARRAASSVEGEAAGAGAVDADASGATKPAAAEGVGSTVAPTSSTDLFGSIMVGISNKLAYLRDLLNDLKQQLFAAVLVLIIACELFASPTEKLADDLWFEFLDGMDMLEKFGQHKSWAAIGVMIFPVLVTVVVYNTPCLWFKDIPSIQIHFFVFAGLLSIAFVLGFFYPIFQEDRRKVHRRNKLYRGVKTLCIDGHAFLYTMSVIILGMLSAVLYNFLFWWVEDAGGSELIMGCCVAVAALSHLVMLIMYKWLVRKISSPGAIVMGFLTLGARFVLYSFLWNPWFVLVGEALHGFGSTLIWGAVWTYPEFRLNPFVMDRSALGVMNAIHQGIGFAIGSIVSGFLYDHFGLKVVLQGASALCGGWCILFAILHKCIKKKEKVRYAKLLQEDETYSDDDSVSYEDDDWLEVALKDQK